MYHHLRLFTILVSFFFLLETVAGDDTYNPLAYRRIVTARSEVLHTVEIDSADVAFEIRSSDGLARLGNMLQPEDIAAINGGFFSKDGYSVGTIKTHNMPLRVSRKSRGVVGWKAMNNRMIWYFDRLKLGNDNQIVSSLRQDVWWHDASHILGGAPLLIFHGVVLDYDEEELLSAFVSRSYARSAICQHKNGRIYLILVEGGANWTYFAVQSGMSLPRLQEYLYDFGCFNALNLDGGYSSTLFNNGRIYKSINYVFVPQRKIHNIIAIKR